MCPKIYMTQRWRAHMMLLPSQACIFQAQTPEGEKHVYQDIYDSKVTCTRAATPIPNMYLPSSNTWGGKTTGEVYGYIKSANANDAMQRKWEWCNANMNDAIQCMTSLLPTRPNKREWGLQPQYSSMCVVVPVLTAPIWLQFLQMHINGRSAKMRMLQCITSFLILHNCYIKELYHHLWK
jgi:hypothetical protein